MTVNPAYTRGRERRRAAIELYAEGLSVYEIAERLGVSVTSVWRYVADRPHVQAASRIPNIWPGRRPPYWELHTRLGVYEIVCGRKFCSRCGIWRQLADFPPDGKKLGQPLHHCRTCENTARRYYDQQMTPAQLENRRERHRIYAEGQRRAAGVPPTTARRRRLTDAREAIYLSVEPLRELMKQTDALMSDRDLAARAGLPERTVWRVRHENGKVQLDVADKLAVALGTTSKLLWGEEW